MTITALTADSTAWTADTTELTADQTYLLVVDPPPPIAEALQIPGSGGRRRARREQDRLRIVLPDAKKKRRKKPGDEWPFWGAVDDIATEEIDPAAVERACAAMALANKTRAAGRLLVLLG